MVYNKILELVENKQLDITTVSLAEVTDEFIKYVNSLEAIEPRLLADFVVVAARLILIKSKVLLPSLPLTNEEEEEVRDLQDRLALYQTFRAAAVNVKSLWGGRPVSGARPYLLHRQPIFYPPQQLAVEQLTEMLKNVLLEAEKLSMSWQGDKKSVKIKLISIEQRVKELLKRFASSRSGKFSQLVSNSSRGEVVATFLAILHLLKDNVVQVKQDSSFSDFYIKKT